MEIISIPLEGDLEHQDSMNNTTIIRKGDIQVMSAGTGVYHSEYNKNKEETVKFLQIWVFPNKKNVTPRYDQISLNIEERKNRLQQILSPNQNEEGVWIHQDAWFHLGNFGKGQNVPYQMKKEGNGLYAFILKGSFVIDDQEMGLRDGLGITGTNQIDITAREDDAEILLMEVPMNLH
jgi:redox-sensitive bicupin YhaK (pirin superfamily)